MKIKKLGLTFDDVLLLPRYSTVLPKSTDVRTNLTQVIKLNTPFLSAAMDTVTEAKLAIAIAQEGGMGIIHKNISIKAQMQEIRKVKRYESGIIREPITISKTATVAEVLSLQKQHGISGLPVMDDEKLIGLVTSRDVRFEQNLEKRIFDVMTPYHKLITASEKTDMRTIKGLLHRYKIERILLIDNAKLRGMITVRDIKKSLSYPNAAKDEQERLRVGAAVGVGHDGNERTQALVDAGVDAVIIDTAHGHSEQVISQIKKNKKMLSRIISNCR